METATIIPLPEEAKKEGITKGMGHYHGDTPPVYGIGPALAVVIKDLSTRRKLLVIEEAIRKYALGQMTTEERRKATEDIATLSEDELIQLKKVHMEVSAELAEPSCEPPVMEGPVAQGLMPHSNRFPLLSRDWEDMDCKASACICNRDNKCIMPSRAKIGEDGRCTGFLAKTEEPEPYNRRL